MFKSYSLHVNKVIDPESPYPFKLSARLEFTDEGLERQMRNVLEQIVVFHYSPLLNQLLSLIPGFSSIKFYLVRDGYTIPMSALPKKFALDLLSEDGLEYVSESAKEIDELKAGLVDAISKFMVEEWRKYQELITKSAQNQ